MRCQYREDGLRCQRNGFGNPALCRAHALAGNLGFDLDDPPVGALIDRADRFLAGHQNPLIQSFAGILGQVLAGRPPRDGPPLEAQAPPRPRAAPPPAPPKEDPRDVLGFAPGTKLTRAIVKERQRTLAKLWHPDHGGTDANACVSAGAPNT